MEQKDQLDGLKVLLEHFWNEWTSKVTYQWKLSLAIWGALLTTILALASNKIPISTCFATILSLAIMAIHAVFIFWAKMQIGHYRTKFIKVQDRIYELIEYQIPHPIPPRIMRWYWAEITILLITLLLCTLFISIVFMANTNEPIAII